MKSSVVYCLGWMAWGRGKTEAEAIKNWRAAGPYTARSKVKVTLVRASESSWVNDDDPDTIHTPNGDERPVKIGEREVSA
jgi:hypothetical protein